jgi:hypothetical protein
MQMISGRFLHTRRRIVLSGVVTWVTRYRRLPVGTLFASFKSPPDGWRQVAVHAPDSDRHPNHSPHKWPKLRQRSSRNKGLSPTACKTAVYLAVCVWFTWRLLVGTGGRLHHRPPSVLGFPPLLSLFFPLTVRPAFSRLCRLGLFTSFSFPWLLRYFHSAKKRCEEQVDENKWEEEAATEK